MPSHTDDTSGQERTHTGPSFRHRVEDAAIRAVISGLHMLPYRRRVALGGWLFSRVVAPLAGYRRRIRANLDLVMPDLSVREKKRLVREIPDNIGRTFTELYSPDGFVPTARAAPVSGPGWDALQAARAAGRPAILVSGHLGNYDVVRAGLVHSGILVGGLYRPMNNRLFNDHYVEAMSAIGTPLFARGRSGMGQMIRFLKSGGNLAILIDQRMFNGKPLSFFGQPAYTALSAAELALKYDALLIPCYSLRQPDGFSFAVTYEDPIPHSSAEVMTQALNDSLEARVRANMDQWFWVHNRWKLPKTSPNEAQTKGDPV